MPWMSTTDKCCKVLVTCNCLVHAPLGQTALIRHLKQSSHKLNARGYSFSCSSHNCSDVDWYAEDHGWSYMYVNGTAVKVVPCGYLSSKKYQVASSANLYFFHTIIMESPQKQSSVWFMYMYIVRVSLEPGQGFIPKNCSVSTISTWLSDLLIFIPARYRPFRAECLVKIL